MKGAPDGFNLIIHRILYHDAEYLAPPQCHPAKLLTFIFLGLLRNSCFNQSRLLPIRQLLVVTVSMFLSLFLSVVCSFLFLFARLVSDVASFEYKERVLYHSCLSDFLKQTDVHSKEISEIFDQQLLVVVYS